MWNLGLLIGHNPLNSKFLGTWCISGLVKKSNKLVDLDSFYLLKYVYTLVGFRMFSGYMKTVVVNRLAIVFVSHNIKFGGLSMFYAMLAGEAFSGYNWVAGALTNWKEIVGFIYMVYIYYKRGFKLNHKHKKMMVILSGINFSRLSKAGLTFFFRLKEASVALQEGGSATLMSTGIADTDVMASELNLPLVANDTSVYSLHFFGYFLALNTLKFKMHILQKWNYNLRRSSKLRLKLFFFNLIFVFNQGTQLKDVNSYFNYVVNKNTYDTNFILEGLTSFNLGGGFGQQFFTNSKYKINNDLLWGKDTKTVDNGLIG